jgi:hypothetical protein
MLRTGIASVLLLLLAVHSPAQTSTRPAGVFADPSGLASTLTLAGTPFEIFTIYVVGFDLEDVSAYAFQIAIESGAGLGVVEVRPVVSEGGGGNSGNLSALEFITATGGCLAAGSGAFVLAEVDLLSFDPSMTDVEICLAPSSDPSLDAPFYVRCEGDLVAFEPVANGRGIYPDGCLILNPTLEPPVKSEHVRLGTVKRWF